MDRIYCSEQIEVPPALPAILKAYTKEVIRYSPKDIPAFSRESAAHTGGDRHARRQAATTGDAVLEEMAALERSLLVSLDLCVCVVCLLTFCLSLVLVLLLSCACSYFAALAKGDVESFLEDQAKKKKAADAAAGQAQ